MILFFIISLCLTSLCGCRMNPYPEEHVMVVSQTSYAFPSGNAFEYDSRSEILETDEYGRVLFAYNNGFGDCSVGIRQKHDDKYVYYYDNVSFLYTSEYRVSTPEQINGLKEANDWNEPLNEGKMIKRKFVNQYSLSQRIDPVLEQKELTQTLYMTIEETEKTMILFNVFDVSQAGQQLFYVERRINISTTGGYEYSPFDSYFMILNADGSYDPENYLLIIDDMDESNSPSLLAEIKERNGWVG